MKRLLQCFMFIVLLLPAGLTQVQAQNIGQVEGLKSFGPTDPAHGYPFYFEDKKDLRLMLCDTFTHCFLELPFAGLPLQFPYDPADPNNNFPDESFFFAGGAGFMGGPVDPTTGIRGTATRALYGMAIEGAFFNEEIVDGDQIVFARVRIRIDDLILGESYRITHPYGVYNFVAEEDAGPGVHKGPGLSLVRDLGITGPGEFAGALDGDIGPFLIPTRFADNIGNFVGPGFLANGKTYISDTTTEETVTGSPLGTNFFRIEGPGVGDDYDPSEHCSDPHLGPDPLATNDCIQTNLFTLQGMIAENFGASINSATYSKDGDGVYVNTWASSIPGQRLAASVDGGPWIFMTEGSDGDGSYFIRTKLADDPGVSAVNAAIPVSVTVLNLNDLVPNPSTQLIVDHLTITANHVVGSVMSPGGLTVTVKSSNIYDPLAPAATIYTGFNDPDLAPIGFNLTDDPLADGFATGTLEVSPTAMAAPYLTVKVESALGGSAETKIAISGGTAGTSLGLIANAGPDTSGDTGGITLNLRGSNSFGPTGMTYDWTHNDTTGLFTLNNSGQAVANVVTPLGTEPAFPLSGILEVEVTLTVSDLLGGLPLSTDVAIVTIEHPVALPDDICNIVEGSYKPNKGRWVVVGDCNIATLQLIEIFLGDASGPGTIKIGETHVAPILPVVWEVTPGNDSAPLGSAAAGTDANEDKLFSHVWAVSSRGSISSFDYEVK
ncbi:MAG: hypothetical protein ABGX83_01740 [Nitrospira sp.]|nr:hypothetical protein [Candidatus Manganitrophaceae bacterium]